MIYPVTPPLDELLASWHESLTERRQLHSIRIAAELAKEIEYRAPSSHDKAMCWVQDRLRAEVWPLVVKESLPACLEWISGKGGSKTALTDDLVSELANAGGAIAVPTICPESRPHTYNPYSWVLPAAFGGLVGALLDGWRGSFITSLVFIAGMGWLLGQPAVRGCLGSTGGVPEQRGSRKSLLSPFVAALVEKLEIWIVRLVIRPYANPENPVFTVSQLLQLVDDYFTACGDLVLIVCWARVTAQPPVSAPEADGEQVPDSLFDSIRFLQRALESEGQEPEMLQDAAQELVQAFVSEGYTWKSVPRGSLFEQRLLTYFKTYGNIGEGQPVKMLKSALCKQGAVVIRGTIKRL